MFNIQQKNVGDEGSSTAIRSLKTNLMDNIQENVLIIKVLEKISFVVAKMP